MHGAHVVGVTDEAAGDEELRQRRSVPPHQRTELGEERRVHGHVPLVNADAEATQDGTHVATGLECGPHGAEGGEVEHDAPLARH